MNVPDGTASRVGVALLVVGYPASVAVLVRILPVLRERRRRRWFGVLVAGLSCLTVGWAPAAPAGGGGGERRRAGRAGGGLGLDGAGAPVT